eukprot:11391140-Alexandrium_andersonii.AAC.1
MLAVLVLVLHGLGSIRRRLAVGLVELGMHELLAVALDDAAIHQMHLGEAAVLQALLGELFARALHGAVTAVIVADGVLDAHRLVVHAAHVLVQLHAVLGLEDVLVRVGRV